MQGIGTAASGDPGPAVEPEGSFHYRYFLSVELSQVRFAQGFGDSPDVDSVPEIRFHNPHFSGPDHLPDLSVR